MWVPRRQPESPQRSRGEQGAETQLQQRVLQQEVELARGWPVVGDLRVLFPRAEAQHLLPHLQREHPQQAALQTERVKKKKEGSAVSPETKEADIPRTDLLRAGWRPSEHNVIELLLGVSGTQTRDTTCRIVSKDAQKSRTQKKENSGKN